ncbi:MAG: hypothetical protein EYC70_15265 [Planctomycetota bacterium]|nr:MAG: hypothetical protein EYC70_15265 [Planctomycetota bacterium]
MKLVELLKKVDPRFEAGIREAKNEQNQTLRSAVRDEMRLLLSHSRTSHNVRVDVEPGYPTVLERVELPNVNVQAEHLIAYRRRMECYVSDSAVLRKAIEDLPHGTTSKDDVREKYVKVIQESETLVRRLLQFAVQNAALTKILEIDEDILGTYNFEDGVGRVRLYWAVIGFVSQSLGVKPEDLGMVVLVHELAHAYTHLGVDADGRIWSKFFHEDRRILEGLAQYYTDAVVNRIGGQSEGLGIKSAYERLTQHQPETYRRHLEWVNKWHPEVVRAAMLEARNGASSDRDRFEQSLEEHAKRLRVRGDLF